MQQIGRKKGTHRGTHVCMTFCPVKMSKSATLNPKDPFLLFTHNLLTPTSTPHIYNSIHTPHTVTSPLPTSTLTSHPQSYPPPPPPPPPSHTMHTHTPPHPNPPFLQSPALHPGEAVNCVHVPLPVTHLRILLQVLLDELLGVRVDILPHILTCTTHRYI